MGLSFSEQVRSTRAHFHAKVTAFDLRESVPAVYQWLIVLLLFLLLPTRRLGLFVHPNFYAEDAQVWYVQAYSGGWLHSLLIPAGGYLNTLQRLLTGVALLVPFHLAPLVDAFLGLAVQILPVPVLLSSRCRSWSPLSVRCLFAALYAFFPNAAEIHVFVTNSQWHLAPLLLLLAFAEPPRTVAGKIADVVFFLFAGFCGPFGLLLLPCLLLYWAFTRYRPWPLVQTASVAIGSFVQGWEILHGEGRYRAPLGATIHNLVHILGVEVFLESVTGPHYRLLFLSFAYSLLWLCAGIAVVVYCCRFSPLPLKLFLLYASLMLAVALHSPLIDGPKPLWDSLAMDSICRYWFLPGLAFLWCAAWCARLAPSAAMRYAGGVILLVTCMGILVSWRYESFPNRDFPVHAREFEAAPPGTLVRIPINPGDDRFLEIVKR